MSSPVLVTGAPVVSDGGSSRGSESLVATSGDRVYVAIVGVDHLARRDYPKAKLRRSGS